MQHQRKKRSSSSSIEESIVSVANMTLRIRRQLESATTDGEEEGGQQRKRRRTSRYKHGRAQQAIYEDYFAPIPVFNDRQFERIFRVTKSIVQQVFDTCARTDPFFTDCKRCHWKIQHRSSGKVAYNMVVQLAHFKTTTFK